MITGSIEVAVEKMNAEGKLTPEEYAFIKGQIAQTKILRENPLMISTGTKLEEYMTKNAPKEASREEIIAKMQALPKAQRLNGLVTQIMPEINKYMLQRIMNVLPELEHDAEGYTALTLIQFISMGEFGAFINTNGDHENLVDLVTNIPRLLAVRFQAEAAEVEKEEAMNDGAKLH